MILIQRNILTSTHMSLKNIQTIYKDILMLDFIDDLLALD